MPRSARWAELRDAAVSLGGCLCPWLRKFRVKYFRYFKKLGTNLQDREWIEVDIMAYNREDAAKRVTERNSIDPPLRPGYNCFVSRVIGG
jgi:hypothetical protein